MQDPGAMETSVGRGQAIKTYGLFPKNTKKRNSTKKVVTTKFVEENVEVSGSL